MLVDPRAAVSMMVVWLTLGFGHGLQDGCGLRRPLRMAMLVALARAAVFAAAYARTGAGALLVLLPANVALFLLGFGTTACCGSMDARTGFSYKAVAVAAATLAAGAFFVAFSAPSAEFHVGAEGSPHADASFSALAA